MNVHEALCILKTAIKNVKPYYVKIEAVPCNKIKKEQVERSFAYELYHQWSLLLNAFQELVPNSNNLRLNGEITKNLDLKTLSYPDMILHEGQENFANQLMVCEIKRVDGSYPEDKKIVTDLKKLSKYLHFKFKIGKESIDASYQCAAFIVANISKSNLKKKIRKALEGNSAIKSKILKDGDKIHCFSVEFENEKLKVEHFTLAEVSFSEE